jgi:hypothetical protein
LPKPILIPCICHHLEHISILFKLFPFLLPQILYAESRDCQDARRLDL